MRPGGKQQAARPVGEAPDDDPLYVRSVEKGFRVLAAFGSGRATLSLAQIALETKLDKSAAQRFTHTLARLGYLRKDPDTKRFELTTRALDLGYHYTRASPLVERSLPYLMHLSRDTEETVSLTVLDGNEIVYVSRFMSRYMLNTNIIIGSRLPAYCTAPGRAMLSRLPTDEAHAILGTSELRSLTPHTIWRMPELRAQLAQSARRGYALANEEIFANDISIASAVLGGKGEVLGAVSIAVSKLRCPISEAEERFAPLVTAASQAMSQSGPPPLA
jgi:IclR family transcriptional regulator, pca regulon regulatory protein